MAVLDAAWPGSEQVYMRFLGVHDVLEAVARWAMAATSTVAGDVAAGQVADEDSFLMTAPPHPPTQGRRRSWEPLPAPRPPAAAGWAAAFAALAASLAAFSAALRSSSA